MTADHFWGTIHHNQSTLWSIRKYAVLPIVLLILIGKIPNQASHTIGRIGATKFLLLSLILIVAINLMNLRLKLIKTGFRSGCRLWLLITIIFVPALPFQISFSLFVNVLQIFHITLNKMLVMIMFKRKTCLTLSPHLFSDTCDAVPVCVIIVFGQTH